MRPEEIIASFGKDGLEQLYSGMRQWTVQELMNEVLLRHTEQEIGKWVMCLREDEDVE